LSEWLPFSSIVGKQCDFEEIIFEENRPIDFLENRDNIKQEERGSFSANSILNLAPLFI